MSDGIYMDHSQVGVAIEDLQNQTQKIINAVTDLENQIRPALSSWSGPDRDVYTTQVQPGWDRNVNKLKVSLDNLILILTDNKENYVKTSRTNEETFRNIPVH
ncbi:WXG100 family type VII secretion target [Streptomyces sp. NPDC001068]|uniref:WXG100 family type VII secretion target n=1 Tax=Streptomyces sp. NPDC001068 TaxID=3364544 RepID=UPI00367DFD53